MNFIVSWKVLVENEAVVVHLMVPLLLGVPSML